MKKIFILIFIVSFFLLSCEKKEADPVVKKYYKTALVQSGNILESESFVGYTESFHQTDLSSKIGGKIINITKNIGDRVKVGELVAYLDSNEAKTGVSSSTEIINSLQTLKNSTKQMYDSQITVLEEKMKQAKIGIEMADIGVSGTLTSDSDTKNITKDQLQTIDTQISQAETSLQSIELQLENTKSTLEQKKNDIYINSKNALQNAIIFGNTVVDNLDNLFGITEANKYKNDTYEIYIGAKDSNLKMQFENDFRNFLSNWEKIKHFPTENNEEIENVLEQYYTFFSTDMRNILKTSYIVLEKSIVGGELTQNRIDSNKSQITNFQNQNEAIILTVNGNYFLGLKGSIDSISSFKKEMKSSIDMLEKQKESAQKQIDTFKQTKKQISSIGSGQISTISTQIEISKKQKEINQNELSQILASKEALKKQRDASLAEIDTQISQVKAGKNDAKVMIENGKVISLITGIVTKKSAEVGNTVSPGMPILTVSSDDKVKIEIQVSQDFLNEIILGKMLTVEIEGINEMKNGIITKILPTRDLVTKKAIIEITVNNDKNDIKIGSYSKVYLDINQKKDGILIPNTAIVSKFMVPQIFVLEGNKAILTDIKIIKQNDNFSQVEGIQVGKTIITDGKENIFDGEELYPN